MPSYPFALQLYSVRDHLSRNPVEGLSRVREAGYRYVELAGYYDLPVTRLKELLDEYGLNAVSMHVGYELVVGRIEDVIRDAQFLGAFNVVVPWVGSEICPDRDAWLDAAESMDDAGAILRKAGLSLSYHNHAHEFEYFDDEMIFDLIFSNSDPENLQVELDLCWATVGKADVLEILNRYQGRIPLIHVKDYKPGDEDGQITVTELGQGVMDFSAVLPAALNAGAGWFIVEQDSSEKDTLESARENAVFMKEFGRQETR